jgi:hypothetical protein
MVGTLKGAAERSKRLTACLLGLLIFVGCASSETQGNRMGAREGRGTTTTRPAGQDYLSGQAGGMAEEDARRTKTAVEPGQRTRPDVIRRDTRSPVDQPRLR